MSLWKASVLNGGIVSSPIWEDHPQRAKNWLAAIAPAPTSPGGLRRQFLPYGRGEFRYMVAMLEVFDAVEFAADYLSMAGNRSRKRWYGVVRSVSPAEIAIEEVGSAVTALLRSVELSTQHRLDVAARQALDAAARKAARLS